MKDRGNIKSKSRGTYSWDPSKMLNIGEIPLYDYIMNLIYLEKVEKPEKVGKVGKVKEGKEEKVKITLVKFKDVNYQTFNK